MSVGNLRRDIDEQERGMRFGSNRLTSDIAFFLES